jgi:hypothetical protein
VEQGHYGHPARKATWLYVYGFTPPPLRWGPCGGKIRLDDGFHSAEERERAIRTEVCQRLSHRERAATPPEFRDLLLNMARAALEEKESESEQEPEEDRYVTREMALDAGDPSLEGQKL